MAQRLRVLATLSEVLSSIFDSQKPRGGSQPWELVALFWRAGILAGRTLHTLKKHTHTCVFLYIFIYKDKYILEIYLLSFIHVYNVFQSYSTPPGFPSFSSHVFKKKSAAHICKGMKLFREAWSTYQRQHSFNNNNNKNPDSPSPSNHQLSRAPGLEVGASVFHSRMLTGLILSRSCSGNHSCCEFLNVEVLSV